MELYSLHPLPDDAARHFLQLLTEYDHSPHGNTSDDSFSHPVLRRLRSGKNLRPNDLSYGLAVWLSTQQPVFTRQGASLSSWEVRIDRGSGMLLRPPSRLFGEAGLDLAIARQMPIRIEGEDSMVGGAYVPARLIGQYLERLDEYLERSVRRLVEAEMEPSTFMGTLYEAARFAAANGWGLYEAIDVLDPADPGTWPPHARIVTHSTDRVLLERIRIAAEPPKQPGVIRRLLGRRGHPTS